MSSSQENIPTRRDALKNGAKALWVPPVISTFLPSQAYAANYSCYPQGHSCDTASDPEPCCPGLNCTGPQPNTCKP